MSDEILTLVELVAEYQKGNIKEEGKTYHCYMTEDHKKSGSVGFIHDSQFKGLVEYAKVEKKSQHKLIWGKDLYKPNDNGS